MSRIGKQIKTLRKGTQVSQKDLGYILNVSPQAISKWEQGVSDPDINLIPKIAEYFGVSIDSLFQVPEPVGIGAKIEYSMFLFAMLLKDTTTEKYEEMQYDLLFIAAQELYEDYDKSDFNKDSEPEYECMVSYLQETVK